MAAGAQRGCNLRMIDADTIGVSLDETTTVDDLRVVFEVLCPGATDAGQLDKNAGEGGIPVTLMRQSAFLEHPVFNSYHSETEMLRYIRKLESRDLSLTRSMIPLGSCTMKLNATAEMMAIAPDTVMGIHPFAPLDQVPGYLAMFEDLEDWLAQITGFDAVSLQPNSGAQGEYAGLLVIRGYHEARGEGHRRVCLIPGSAHGTNPAARCLRGWMWLSWRGYRLGPVVRAG